VVWFGLVSFLSYYLSTSSYGAACAVVALHYIYRLRSSSFLDFFLGMSLDCIGSLSLDFGWLEVGGFFSIRGLFWGSSVSVSGLFFSFLLGVGVDIEI
jgi:hypothetical protein